MPYELETHPTCGSEIHSLCKKNPVLEQALRNKIKKVLDNPNHFKPLRHSLAGERRVHVLKNFVLRFEVIESENKVRLLYFGHHDEAYRR